MKPMKSVTCPSTGYGSRSLRLALALSASLGLGLAATAAQAACYAPGLKADARIAADARISADAGRILAEGLDKSGALGQIDVQSNESFSVLVGEDGNLVGWMEANGTTYDASGKLFARVDSNGNVVAADGSVLFEAQSDCAGLDADAASDGNKMSWHWGWPPTIRFNRAETRRIDAYGSLVVAPICAAAAAVASAAATPAVGAAVGVACLAQTGAIIGVARYAVRHNKCEQISVPASVPSTWGC
jgi:hypothetical protein